MARNIADISVRRLCSSFSTSLSLEKANHGDASMRAGGLEVTCLSLDRDQALLACGTAKGVLSIYDVDEIMFSAQLR